jgi:hypothetical protein
MEEVLRIRYPFGSVREHVPASVVRDRFAATFGPKLRDLGFRPCRDQAWVTDSIAPIRHAVVLRLNRVSHYVIWGLKFDFVPYITDDDKLHRHSDKDSDTWFLDLIHEPYAECEHDVRSPFKFGVTSFLGSRIVDRHLRRERRRLIPRIRRFVRSVGSMSEAIDLYQSEHLRQVHDIGFDNRIPHWVSYPFVLMANGQADEAVARFEAALARLPHLVRHRAKLESLLAACKPESNP